MIDILPAPSHVAAFHIHETLTAEDYDKCIAEVDARLAEHPRISIYCDLVGMGMVTPVAMAKDLRYALGKLGEYHRFARGAIVTERDWLGSVMRLASVFFPHTDLRAFTPAERAAALAWASQELPKA